jgi:two-component system cell cycle response regulator CtrA
MPVLLIEGDPAPAKFIELALMAENFSTYTAELGKEGLDLGKLCDYDVILLDLNLPDMSGFDVLRILRFSNVKTPVLILSGISHIDEKVSALGLGGG